MSETRRELEKKFEACELARPFRRASYDPGHRLELPILGVVPANSGRMVVEIERSVGGGFAGQVYRVRLVSVEADGEPIAGLQVGNHYAVKILIPPSSFSRMFRNVLFKIGYQGHFAAQVNPASVRVGVLWQKLIRRAAAQRFGRDDAVCDTFATFYDPALCAFGEINEWIDGRIWKLEVDDGLFERWDFEGDPPGDANAAEYIHKKKFMRELVELLHDMGAPELARQYEWWTTKSQPNVLKRTSRNDSPSDGLTAVDFRAGLTLLPFLPMSPVDVPLIVTGLLRGRIVQFDRSDPNKRDAFFERHGEQFEDLQPAIEELGVQEELHRGSLPDVTHHHVRLLYDRKLHKTLKAGRLSAWRHLGRIDDDHAERLWEGRLGYLFALLVSLVPFVGRRLIELWGNPDSRRHFVLGMTDFGYMFRSMRASRIEALIRWHRAGRMHGDRVLSLVDSPVRFWAHRLSVGWLPAKWHRFVTDWRWAAARFRDAVGFAFRFLWRPIFREQWLLEQVELGRAEGMLTPEEADRVSRDIKDPYMQKYLRCLAVHVCTVPVTQITMVVVGLCVAGYLYFFKHVSWGEASVAGSAAGVMIQLMPISPGSITRGVFVLFLMIKERDIKNYYIAAPVAFIHVVGYLAFPLQMVTKNAGLARFMAGRWATGLARVIPVFGERGGLLEHVVFDLFFNLPLSLKRAFKRRPLVWTTGAVAMLAFVISIGVGLYARAWEWRQEPVRVESTLR